MRDFYAELFVLGGAEKDQSGLFLGVTEKKTSSNIYLLTLGFTSWLHLGAETTEFQCDCSMIPFYMWEKHI